MPETLVLLAAALAGLVRGFSGFGAAMAFVPLASMVIPTAEAVVLLFITDTIVSLPMVLPALKKAHWREIVPLALGATLMTPVGVWVLLHLPEAPLRWMLSLTILIAVGALLSGWRHKGHLSVPGTVGVGCLSGLFGGFASLHGPPVLLFWLSGQKNAAQVRANVIAFFASLMLVSAATYSANGMFTWRLAEQSLWLLPLYGLPLWFGAFRFKRSGEVLFRRIALGLCGAAAVVALPVW